MTVDGRWCLVGSANWDMRSFRLNFELNVEIYHPALASQLEQFIAQKQEVLLTADSLNRASLAVLSVVVALVLLIACANIANLMLVRSLHMLFGF